MVGEGSESSPSRGLSAFGRQTSLWALARRDDAFRSLGFSLPMTVISSNLLLGLLYSLSAWRREPLPAAAVISVVWLAMALYLVFGRTRSRCGRLELALPLSARRLWLGHLLAVIGSGALVVAATIGLITLLRGLVGASRGVPPSSLDLSQVAIASGVSLVVAVVLLESWEAGLRSPSVNAKSVLRTLLILLGTLLLAVAHTLLPPWTAILPLAAAVLLGWRVLHSLPEALTLAPREAEDGATAPGGAEREGIIGRTGTRLGLVRGANWLLWRSIHHNPKIGIGGVLFLYPLLFFFGMIFGGLLHAGDLGDLRYVYIPLGSYLLFAVTGPGMHQMRHFDSLPVSRGRLFALLFLPLVAVLVLGFGAGWLSRGLMRDASQLVAFEERDGHFFLSVPIHVCEVAWDGTPPPSGSPWDESHEPEQAFPVRGSRTTLYSPFSTPEGSTLAFVALQVQRAVETVFGATIPAAEIERRYLEVSAGGRVRPRDGRLTLLADHPELEPRWQGPVFPVIFTLVTAPALVLIGLFLRTFRANRPEWVRQTAYWAFMVLPVATMVGLGVVVFTGLANPHYLRGLVEILIRRAGEAPQGIMAVWIAAAALLLTAWRFALAQFGRIEMPVLPSTFTLMDWARKRD